MTQRARARRGTSLIEVLVVLVILVIGILAIARLFPAGFVALRNAENNSFADRLAQGALEQLKQDNVALADGVYMYTDALGFNPNVAPDDFFAFAPDANGYNTSHDFGSLTDLNNNINKQRYISNETVTVGGNRASTATFFPLHFLTYGPISLPDPTALGNYLIVNGLPWTSRTGDARRNPNGDPSGAMTAIDDPRDILEANQATFMVDYGAGKLAVPPAAYAQTFVVTVQSASGPATFQVVTHASTGSQPYDGDWFDSSGNTASQSSAAVINGVMPQGPWTFVSLYRPFQYKGMTTAPSFTADPYEFALYSPNMGTTNMGVLAFNPLAAGRGTGAQPLKARISYSALDWHILHEDHDVAAGDANGGPTVRLRLSRLKKVGDIQFDDTIFAGLLTGAPTANQYDVLMMNIDTGAMTGLAAPQNGSTSGNTQDADQNDAPDASKYSVSYQNGRVTFPANSPGQRVRFYYMGDADWAVAVQRAPSYYTHSLNADGTENAPGVAVPGPLANRYAIGSASLVYFPLCDAGKTVEFDGITYSSGNAVKQIGQGTATISTDTVNVGGARVVYANLTSGGLNAAGVIPDPDASITGLRFNAVRGVSARAIVIWREQNKWRSRSLDTLLTQAP